MYQTTDKDYWRAFERAMLRAQPANLNELWHVMGQVESYADFIAKVDELVPEYKGRILAVDTAFERAMRFVEAVGKKWGLPFLREHTVWQVDEEGYAVVEQNLALPLEGMTGDTYHQLDEYGDGVLFAACLTMCPYIDTDKAGTMIPWRDQMSQKYGRDVMAFLEESFGDGLAPEDLWLAVRGTKFEGVGWTARWLWGEVGNLLYDMDYEMGSNDLYYTKDDLDWVKVHHQEAVRIRKKIHAFQGLLEKGKQEVCWELLKLVKDVWEKLPKERRDYAKRFYNKERDKGSAYEFEAKRYDYEEAGSERAPEHPKWARIAAERAAGAEPGTPEPDEEAEEAAV